MMQILMYTEDLVKEIKNEMFSDKQVEDMVSQFEATHPRTPKELLACSACGICVYEEKYKRCRFNDDAAVKFIYPEHHQRQFLQKYNST